MSFLSELRRRNVFRVAAAYAVSAWLLIEIADILFPAFGFPLSALRLLIVVLALGLVPIVLLAWAYELTASGLVRDRGPGAEGAENINTGRRLDQVTIAMILLALGVVVVERFVLPQRVATETGSASISARTETASTPQPVPIADADPVPSPPDRRSIAVLPFANLSPDPDNAYFADGISEELLNVLAGVEGLKVASRTSAFSFKGTATGIPEIARQLGVAHVLEGSVRKQGLRVRITAQLIDAHSDAHLWSDSYDRELTDVFALQEEIAQAIADALRPHLGEREVAVPALTRDLVAYEDFLRGRQLFYQRGQGLVAARALLEQAVARDPEFAEAWAALAAVHYVSSSYLPVPSAETLPLARRAAQRALALDDALGLPYAVLGSMAAIEDRVEGERLLTLALERDPQDATIWLWRGIHFIEVGHFTRAEPDLRRALELDPLSGITHGWFGRVAGLRGRWAEAERHAEQATSRGWGYANLTRAQIALARNDRAAAALHLHTYLQAYGTGASAADAALRTALDAVLTDPARGPQLRSAAEAHYHAAGRNWSDVLATLGLHRDALELEMSNPDPAKQELLAMMYFPGARGLLREPGFMAWAERWHLPAYWRAMGPPDGCTLHDGPTPRLECPP